MFPWSRKCLSVVPKQIQIMTGSVKTKKSCVSWTIFEMEIKFSKLVKITVFRCLQARDICKRRKLKKKKKKKKWKEI